VTVRSLALEGCVNFRDLGGYRTADGNQVAWGRLFRADGLHRLSESDHDVLRGLGLRTVVDLRTIDEAVTRGSFPVGAVPVDYHAFPVTDVLPAVEELDAWAQASYVADRYLSMVTDGGPALASAIGVLAGEDALPAVFHCSAGKDRTGVLSALVLGFVGVAGQVIVDDYALSAPAMVNLMAQLELEYPHAVEEIRRHAPAILTVVPETMELFLDRLFARFGSFTGVAEALGVAGKLPALRDALVVPA